MPLNKHKQPFQNTKIVHNFRAYVTLSQQFQDQRDAIVKKTNQKNIKTKRRSKKNDTHSTTQWFPESF